MTGSLSSVTSPGDELGKSRTARMAASGSRHCACALPCGRVAFVGPFGSRADQGGREVAPVTTSAGALRAVAEFR